MQDNGNDRGASHGQNAQPDSVKGDKSSDDKKREAAASPDKKPGQAPNGPNEQHGKAGQQSHKNDR